MDVVVVESPAKAKTIEKYLGTGFTVLASYGHVRDLPAKDGSVRPDEDFAMDYETDAKAAKHLGAIAKALRGAGRLYLATDPDREGEAISWHVLKALEEKGALDGIEVQRIAFNEITRGAVSAAIAQPRGLDENLINAQQARRALDYLVGFTLSPVLWRKLPGSRSAGRVQSVALRLVCERELEIEAHRAREYWTIEVDFGAADGAALSARLVQLEGKKLGKYDLPDGAAADRARHILEGASTFSVVGVDAKEQKRHPPPPFTTSTLQQEASRKLGLSARVIMQVAQRLYEGIDVGGETVGLITYMRTDGVQIAGEAVLACRRVIGAEYGQAYVPEQPRAYRSKAKNAQEAHEAIRPTDLGRLPAHLANRLKRDEARLYELIWKRTVASQMASARLERAGIDIADGAGRSGLRATGTIVLFDGFLRLYREGRDDVPKDGAAADDDAERRLPALKQGTGLERREVRPDQHFTEPPPRYTEATLVKRMEELGIGRPSTYASILSVLQDRDYVRLDKRRFVPEDRGRLVTAFLSSFFQRYVEYDFTADLEQRLDEISAGQVDWKTVLKDFWLAFSAAVDNTKELRVREVLDTVDEILGPSLFKSDQEGVDPRLCPACEAGRLSLKLGRHGAFVGCSNYPDCRFTRPFGTNGEQAPDTGDAGPRELGSDPESGLMVSLRKGPYGHYLQLGEPEGKKKPKRSSLTKDMVPAEVTLETALRLLALPREIGLHPESGKPITAGIGRFGPYLRHEGRYVSLAAEDSILAIGLNRAVALIADAKDRPGAKALRELGEHPEDGKLISVMSGRYGPYVKHGRLNATIPKGLDPDSITQEQAVALLIERAAKKAGKKKAPAKAKKKSAKGSAKSKTKAKAAAKVAAPGASDG